MVLPQNGFADSDNEWTIPIGIGFSKTSAIGKVPVKYAFEIHYYVEQPDAFGPEWLFKLKVAPVIKNPFL